MDPGWFRSHRTTQHPALNTRKSSRSNVWNSESAGTTSFQSIPGQYRINRIIYHLNKGPINIINQVEALVSKPYSFYPVFSHVFPNSRPRSWPPGDSLAVPAASPCCGWRFWRAESIRSGAIWVTVDIPRCRGRVNRVPKGLQNTWGVLPVLPQLYIIYIIIYIYNWMNLCDFTTI